MALIKPKKAAPEQAYLKVGVFGEQGSGKTLTLLAIAEWLLEQDNARNKTNKRLLVIDTERGTDFYTRDVPERKFHPAGFDFDRVITRGVWEVVGQLQALTASEKNPTPDETYGVVILDSVTHIWEACKEAYSGKRTSQGDIPINGWGTIKRPWKQMMEAGLNGQFHFLFAGREGVVYEKDEESGEDGVTGYKIKAEGEAGYEPHILAQMYQYRNLKKEESTIKMFFMKDRSGCLQGKTVSWPTGAVLEQPYRLLAGQQGTFTTSDDAAAADVKAAQDDIERRAQESIATYEAIRSAVIRANSMVELKAAWELTKGKKKILGDRFEALDALVDGRKAELAAAARGATTSTEKTIGVS